MYVCCNRRYDHQHVWSQVMSVIELKLGKLVALQILVYNIV